jgi:hypothetical protein
MPTPATAVPARRMTLGEEGFSFIGLSFVAAGSAPPQPSIKARSRSSVSYLGLAVRPLCGQPDVDLHFPQPA